MIERQDYLLNIQACIRRVLHDKDLKEHNERNHNKNIHIQHAHKPINRRIEKTNEEEIKESNKLINHKAEFK